MDLKGAVASLSEIERKTLSALSRGAKSEQGLAAETGLNIDSVRRAVNWLSQKGFAEIKGNAHEKLVLTKEGEKSLEKGLSETRMLKALAKIEKADFEKLMKEASLNQQEFNVALGINRKNNFIAIIREEKTKAMLTEAGKEYARKKLPLEEALEKIAEGDKAKEEETKELIARGLAEKKEQTQREVYITSLGEGAKKSNEFSGKRMYNVKDPVPDVFGGKKQPYIQFLNIIRRKLTELGFEEMEAPMIVHEFYNFDILFQPQNHPARTWTDTYQLKNPQVGKLTDRKNVAAVKAAHETGGVSASSGWRYSWLEEIASKVMPTAHGTAHSARQLTKGVKMPGKYFAIARCFRPDVLDATHLIEFNQTEGFIVGEDLNFTHLLGMLEQFAKEIAGAKEVKFIPDYYPFTEPSVQLSAKHPDLGWVELGGAGMFRPEILENLGIKGQAIAWGIGIDRLAMFKLGIKDIRHLFSDDLNWLRKTPLVME
mgnify:FL=1